MALTSMYTTKVFTWTEHNALPNGIGTYLSICYFFWNLDLSLSVLFKSPSSDGILVYCNVSDATIARQTLHYSKRTFLGLNMPNGGRFWESILRWVAARHCNFQQGKRDLYSIFSENIFYINHLLWSSLIVKEFCSKVCFFIGMLNQHASTGVLLMSWLCQNDLLYSVFFFLSFLWIYIQAAVQVMRPLEKSWNNGAKPQSTLCQNHKGLGLKMFQ